MDATTAGVPFEVFGESCYTSFQGPPSAWMTTFRSLATQFPNLKFIIAEYGPEQRAANDIIFNLPNQRGLGHLQLGADHAGRLLEQPGTRPLPRSGTTYTTQPDMALYDQMKIDYASRL